MNHQPVAPGPYAAPPIPMQNVTPKPKKSNVGIFIGLGLIGLSVLAFVGFLILSLVTFDTQFETRTVSGRESIELDGTIWQVAVPADAPDTAVVITDSAGDEIALRPLPPRPGADDDSQTSTDQQPSQWTRIGELRIPSDGDYTVDAGGGSARLTNVDLGGTVTALGLLWLAIMGGGAVFVLGSIVTVVALIIRFS